MSAFSYGALRRGASVGYLSGPTGTGVRLPGGERVPLTVRYGRAPQPVTGPGFDSLERSYEIYEIYERSAVGDLEAADTLSRLLAEAHAELFDMAEHEALERAIVVLQWLGYILSDADTGDLILP